MSAERARELACLRSMHANMDKKGGEINNKKTEKGGKFNKTQRVAKKPKKISLSSLVSTHLSRFFYPRKGDERKGYATQVSWMNGLVGVDDSDSRTVLV